MFVDASAIVAILSREAGHESLSDRLDAAEAPMTSGLALFEAVTAIARKTGFEVPHALSIVREFLARSEVDLVQVDAEVSLRALDAFAEFGKGRGHPAQLNLCDCFAYAMAKQHGVSLLYKGEDFSQTDLA